MTDEKLTQGIAANVCWHIDRAERCIYNPKDDLLFYFGRCRSGKRWFWSAGLVGEDKGRHGWEDTEAQALEAARAAVVEMAAGKKAVAFYTAGWASDKLKEVNAAKRSARPPSNAKGSAAVEYLYSSAGERFVITKKTAKRIYYLREPVDEHHRYFPPGDIGYVNRQKLEAKGEVHNRGVHWCAADFHLYASPPTVRRRQEPQQAKPDLSKLKDEMIKAHPDKGGSHAAFIAARAAYEAGRA